MSLVDVLTTCRESGIRITSRQGKLVLADPDKRLTPALKARLVAVKEELLLWLAKHDGTRMPLVAQVPREVWPLSFAQQRLWFIDQLEHGSAQYNIPYAFGLRGRLHVARLRGALDAIVARHAVLRTVYMLVNGEPVQVVRAASALPLEVIDLGDLDPAAQDARIAAMTEEEGARVFDLSVDSMLRCVLLRRSPDHHVVLFTMHHIASDGWSMGVLIREFVALYANGGAILPPLAVQYSDYACWQRETAGGSLFEVQLAYWRRTLHGMPVVHALPLDRQRPAAQGFVALSHQGRVDDVLLEKLHALARACGATLFMVLQSAFAALVARFSGEHDIAMAVPHAGRDDELLAPLIGLFVNTLVFRTLVRPDMTGHDLVDHGRQVALGAFAHAYVPFDAVRDAVGHERNLAYNPLCQVKFVLQNFEASTLGLDGLVVESMAQSADKVHFDLDLTVVESTHGLHFQWLYKDELFEPASIARLAAAYEGLLAQLVAAPEAALGALRWVDEAEQAQLLAWGRGATLSEGREAMLSRQVEAQAMRTPTAIAVRASTGTGVDTATLDYATLEAQANRLAHALAEMGIGPGARVGVHLERSLALPVALLAVLKSGAAYVVLDHRQPPARLAGIVADAAIAVVLLDSRSTLPVGGLDAVYVDAVGEADFLAGYPSEPLSVTPAASDPAYVLYTSGSTGTPKGVVITHAGLIDYLAFAHEGYYTAELTGSLVLTSPAFDLTVPALFAPWLVGGSVELLPAQDEMVALVERLDRSESPEAQEPSVQEVQNATDTSKALAWLLRMTPSHAQALLALSDDLPRHAPHVFVIGGEAFDAALAARLQAKYPAARLYNHYGPTETVVGCAWQAVNGTEPPGTLPIGRPMSNTVLYVMDAHGRLQPPGVAGELYIGGAGVALGYLNQPTLSADRFVADPWQPDQRVYRSGDRVRWRADGTLAFLGRLDDQVKLRGFRIELGDIEAALRASPGVAEAAVVLRGEGDGARVLAYVTGTDIVPATDTEPNTGTKTPGFTAETIAAYLATQLPAYMLPSAIVPLDTLPRTPSGKLDRRALPEPDARSDAHEPPAPGTEHMLATIWAQLLQRETIGAHDHFFQLGGHSLLATRVASEIDRQLGKRLPVRALFEHPTLRALAAHLDAQISHGHVAIPRADRDAPLPLSFAQQRLWFIDRLEGGSAQYNMPAALRLRGRLDLAALQRALDALLARHDVLRTTFAERDGQGVQVIHPPVPMTIRHHDLRWEAPLDREAALAALATTEAAQPFDLARDPMLRCQLVTLDEDEHALLLTLHHIAADGWSIGVLVGEFVSLYTGQALPALPVQYADYAAWQRGRLQGDRLATQLAYWRAQLADAPVVHGLPLDRPRPPRQAFGAGRVEQRLDRDTLDGLHALARTHEASLFMVLQAAFAAVLSRYSGETDIVVGSPIAGRLHPDVEPLIGFFVNTLVLRTQVDAQANFASLVDHVRETALAAYEHQDVPFEMLVEALQPPRHLAHSPLFQLLLALRNNAESPLEIPGLQIQPLAHDADDQARFDLQVFITETPQGLNTAWIYAGSLFDRATIERIAASFFDVLVIVARDATIRIGELPILRPFDTERLARWNDTARAYADHARIEHLFALNASARPDAIALVHGDRSMTYGELDASSDRVARAIAARGEGRGSRVGLCLSRSFDMVVGLLGILKSGAAYVPMDPALPSARLAFIASDSKPCLILSDNAMSAWEGVDAPVCDVATFGRDGEQVRMIGAADDAAVVFYTSGSTGQPKGVCVPHRTLVNLMTAMSRRHALLRDVVPTLQFATLNFDMSLYEIASALFTGSRLVLLDEHQRLDMHVLMDILERERVGRIYLPTAMLTPFVAAAQQIGAELPALKLIQVAGEALLVTDAVRSWCARHACALLNLYGPTESHVVSEWMLEGAPADWPAVPPIGRPIDNVRLHVLDALGNPVPIGVPGELHIAGDGLALGYLDAPARTSERFIVRADERIYRTGDICRWRGDGVLEYLGRNDFQVKIRGFRVEPGEVEAALVSIDEIVEATVVAGNAPGGGHELHAYVVPRPGCPVEPTTVRAAIAILLPEYMLPASLTVLDALPLNANGKIDRQRLPEPVREEARPFAEPEGPGEVAIAEAWGRIFGIDRVSRHDHFFELGGHSILAIRMLAMLDPSVAGRLQVRDLFVAPTVAGLAALASVGVEAPSWQALVPAAEPEDLPVVYAIPGAGATSGAFQPLASAMRGRATIRVFEHRGMTADVPLPEVFDDVVEENLAALREARPSGPYTLAGHSFGGAIAFAMACALERQDEKVSLILMDSLVYQEPMENSTRVRPSVAHFRHRLPMLSTDHPEDEAFVASFRAHLVDEGWLAEPIDDGILERYLALVDRQLTWFAAFEPARFRGRARAFVAKGGRIATHGADALAMHYTRCMDDVASITLVPGDHYTMLLPPHAASLAEHLACDALEQGTA